MLMAIFGLKWNFLSLIERDTDCDFHTFANIFVVGLYQRSHIGTPHFLPNPAVLRAFSRTIVVLPLDSCATALITVVS
jgi:hypothetical protein